MEKQNLVEIYNLANSLRVSGTDVDRVFAIKQKILQELGYFEEGVDGNGDKDHP